MADSRTVEINGVGLVLFERSKRAKRISISVKPFRGVRVAVPYRSSFRKAEEFVNTRKAWINRHLEKIKRYERKYNYNPDNIDKTKAKTTLVQRLKWLASNHGFSYNRVFIRNQKTRWGSCSSKNNISLNMKLVRLPDDLVDYVILHELAHTIRKDHSKAFWAEMDKLVENRKQMSSQLRSYGMELY
ncbi:M48 family metallopeptidase [Chloroflexota bacterium]